MRTYSMDLRERVWVNLGQESMRQTAERFQVSLYFVYQLKRRYKEAGTLVPKPPGGGRAPIVDEAGADYLCGLLAERGDLTLNESAYPPQSGWLAGYGRLKDGERLLRTDRLGRSVPVHGYTS